MARVTVVTLHVEGSDQTVADGLRTISQTINQFVEQHRAAGPERQAGMPVEEDGPTPKAPPARLGVPARSGTGRHGGKEGPLMAAIRRLLAKKPLRRAELAASLSAGGESFTLKKISGTLSNGRVRGLFRKGAGGVWSLA
jgi:hypothetical protein